MGEKAKSKKMGRKKSVCAAYTANQRREFNKARRLKKYLLKFPFQFDAWEALGKLDKVLYANHRKTLGLTEFMKFRPAKEAVE